MKDILKIHPNEYVHAWNGIACVTLDNGCSCGLDAIWHESCVLDMENDCAGHWSEEGDLIWEWSSFKELPKDRQENWVRMIDLPKDIQGKYLDFFKNNQELYN